MWEKIKSFFSNSITKIVFWVLLFASVAALIVVGVTSGDVTTGIGLVVAIITAASAFFAFVTTKVSAITNKTKRIISTVAWSVLFISVVALIIGGVTAATITDATGLVVVAIAAISAIIAFIIEKTKTSKNNASN